LNDQHPQDGGIYTDVSDPESEFIPEEIVQQGAVGGAFAYVLSDPTGEVRAGRSSR